MLDPVDIQKITDSVIAKIPFKNNKIDAYISDFNAEFSVQWQMAKNVDFNNFHFQMTQAGKPKSNLKITATRAIDDKGFEPCPNAPLEVGFGVYRINLTAKDLNGRCITFRFVAPDADERLITIITQL